MLLPINNLAPACSGKYSLLKCEAQLVGIILTRQGDAFGYCKKHVTLITRAVERLGYGILSWLQPSTDMSPYVVTGPPVKLVAEKPADPKELAVHEGMVEVLNRVAEVNGKLVAELARYARALLTLRAELDLRGADPEEIATQTLGYFRELTATRTVERQELLDSLRELEEAHLKARFLEQSLEALRAAE